jgi:hypothetical protein
MYNDHWSVASETPEAATIRPPQVTANEVEAEGAYVEVSELCQQSATVTTQ